MAPKTIDYDALAKQAGAVSSEPQTVDYDALAKQAGAVSSVPSGGQLLNQESQGVSYVRPGSTTGIAGLPEGTSLPGVPSAPAIPASAGVPDANTQLYQFGSHAAKDISNIPHAIKQGASDWWNNNEGFLGHTLPVVKGAAMIPLTAATQVNDAVNTAIDKSPAAGVSQLFGGNPEAAKQLADQGDLGGAAWEYWGKPGAMAAATETGAKALGALPKPVRNRWANNNFANLIGAGFEHPTEPYHAAEKLRPYYQQELAAKGYNPKGVLSENSPIKRGWTGDFPSRNNDLFGKGNIPETVKGIENQLDVSNSVVDRLQKPIDEVVNLAKNDPVPQQVKDNILSQLRDTQSRASDFGSSNANAYNGILRRVQEAKNVGELNQIKKDANNMIEDVLHGKTPSGIEAANVTEPIMAWKDAGDIIRKEMYPELQRYVDPRSPRPLNLAEQGRLVGQAMDARDGLYLNAKNTGKLNLNEITKSYLEKVGKGSLYKSHVLRRMLDVFPSPAGEMNLAFRRGMTGYNEFMFPESTAVTKQQLKLPAPSAPEPTYPGSFDFSTQPQQPTTIIPPQPPQQLFVGTTEIPNPSYTPAEGPSFFQQRRELGTTAETVPSLARGTQNAARAEADQIGIGHIPPPESGAQPPYYQGETRAPLRAITGPETTTRANFQHLFGTETPEQILPNGSAVFRTQNPEAAIVARDGMREFQKTSAYKAMSAIDREAHNAALRNIDRQVADYQKWRASQPVPPPPGTEPSFQVTMFPGSMGFIGRTAAFKKALSRTLKWEGGALMGRKAYKQVTGNTNEDSPESMQQRIEEQNRLMSQPQ